MRTHEELPSPTELLDLPYEGRLVRSVLHAASRSLLDQAQETKTKTKLDQYAYSHVCTLYRLHTLNRGLLASSGTGT